MLYEVVRRFNPDYVGVEIRPEDMARDLRYLENNYPKEMIELAREWHPKSFGFDWLGDDIANAPIADGWWDMRSPTKRLEHDFEANPSLHSKRLDAIRAAELRILKSATPASLNDGRYDRLNDAYYASFAELVRGSKYEALPKFYAERDSHLSRNVIATINAHRGSRFIVVTGADHRSALHEAY